MRKMLPFAFACALVGCAIDAAPSTLEDEPSSLGGKEDRWSIDGFRFERPLRTVPIELGGEIQGTFDGTVHIGALFTTTSEQRFDMLLRFRDDPEDGVSPHVNLMLYRLAPNTTLEEAVASGAGWQGIKESSYGHDRDTIELSDTGPQPAGTYLALMLASPYTEEVHVGYTLSLLTERDLPCTRGGRIVERGTITGRGTATENGQGWAYYKARGATEEDLRAQLDPIRTRCGEDVRVADAHIELTVLSAWSNGRWVASFGVPTPQFSYSYDWSRLTDEETVDACTEVAKESDSEYASRRFECHEEASIDWACCVL